MISSFEMIKVIYDVHIFHILKMQYMRCDAQNLYGFLVHCKTNNPASKECWANIVVGLMLARFFMLAGNDRSDEIKVNKHPDHERV